ncbi:hypothetical protein AMAG_18495 [Allomyces macrogynus ATCC 38327]|uniref:Uncharacterized protein n=1 Tax=Allomyces macrogynus (strain ATCC 38327) TaxID=578462 RepID=A0A0L0SCM6_ALLM3|nr:hypothetical protein AMAG_18495 [Allomyces macrogynus ATCC 38327]|eukprot:KNE60236.1 hypothetical protein AMAG_18495 [Allomyces macrogynus ATCC 38327]
MSLVGVIVDMGISTALSAYQQSRQATGGWVRPTNATARAAAPMAQFGRPAARQAANAMLQTMIKNKLLAALARAALQQYGVTAGAGPFMYGYGSVPVGTFDFNMKGLDSTRRGNDGTNLTQTAAEEMHQSLQYLNGAQVCRIFVRNFKSQPDLASTWGSIMPQRPNFVAAAQVVHDVGQAYHSASAVSIHLPWSTPLSS